jgi:hypothetical protein
MVIANIKKWAWRLYLPACVSVPLAFGWFNSSRLECSFCFRDVFMYSLAVVGYTILVGAVLVLRQPTEKQAEGSFTALLVALFLGGMAFFLTYKPL